MAVYHKKAISTTGIMLQRYHRDIAKLRKKCESLGLNLIPYKEARPEDICVASLNDTLLYLERCNISDTDTYYLTEPECVILADNTIEDDE